jgi:hypothetical protein
MDMKVRVTAYMKEWLQDSSSEGERARPREVLAVTVATLARIQTCAYRIKASSFSSDITYSFLLTDNLGTLLYWAIGYLLSE